MGLIKRLERREVFMSKIFNHAALLSLFVLAAPAFAFQQPTMPTPVSRLQSNIERITRSVNARWGIYIKCIETGEEISINADEQMDTMSVIKRTPNQLQTYCLHPCTY
jgi:beta-lactamase class A